MSSMKQYYVYILRCRDKSYYVGVTNNVDERLLQHQQGDNPMCYTYVRRPVTLVHVETFGDIKDAIAAEKQIKGWSRKKKEALIRGDEESLHQLSKRHSQIFRC
jgi:putative endonuclease